VDLTITDPGKLYDFWISKAADLPTWHKAAMKIALLPTSTGFVERFVSVFERVIGPQERSSKEATIETRCIVGDNHRLPARRRKHRFDDNVGPEVLEADLSADEMEEDVVAAGNVNDPIA
jgi:hypothetical protein